jgi:hypothetical protein
MGSTLRIAYYSLVAERHKTNERDKSLKSRRFRILGKAPEIATGIWGPNDIANF